MVKTGGVMMSAREVVAGAAAGAALAYMTDPNVGGRRRACARDRLGRAAWRTSKALRAMGRNLTNRTSGVTARIRRRLTREAVDDARLVERVRAALARVCVHPRALEIEVEDGVVVVRGPVRPGETGPVLAAIWAVQGVTTLASQLHVQGSDDEGVGIQRNWPPTTQALFFSAGLTATSLCIAAYGRVEGRRAMVRQMLPQ
jgi:hypothetical protein